MKDNGDVEFTDLFDPRQRRATQETIDARMSICNECPFFRSNMKRCDKCGCFMKLKTTLDRARCPIGKW